MKQLSNFYIYPFIALFFVTLFLTPISVEADASTFVSDDFNSFSLDTGLWTSTDPIGNTTLTMTGTNTQDAWLSISLPAGTSHDVWTAGNQAPRIMQPANNTDFELEVKFESGLSQQYQMQGVLIEEDSDDFLRFDFHSDGLKTRILAAIFEPGPSEPLSPTVKYNEVITDTGVAPLYMRVKREGDQWTQSYSYEGLSWTSSISFTHPLSVNSVGAFVGNTGSSPPAHTGYVDYFFNTASPIAPEDEIPNDPLFISNIQVAPGDTWTTVTWATNEPATSSVACGPSVAYENGSVDNSALVTQHAITLTGLISGTLYHYQVTSVDGSDNTVTSPDLTFTTKSLPIINIWYGSDQVFGHIGHPQQWVNILGNVSDPDGVASLVYSLNGGPNVSLSMGPDDRRLALEGDFNIDIDRADLVNGSNQVVITATDNINHTTVETVTVQYTDANIWPQPYTIDWSTVTDIQDVAQVVDGKWTVGADGVRPVEVDYDRLIAIGDLSWTDYEVTVPIVIHNVDIAGSGGVSGEPGLGLLMRWTGHTDSPISGWQPKTGWEPFGAIGWWRWWGSPSSATLEIYTTGQSKGFPTALEVPYIFKMRVESTPGQGGLYRLKVWEDGQPEPSGWDLTYQAGSSNLANGSFMLLAHHVDASFGDVTIIADMVPPVLSDIQVTPGETWATVTWTTDEPATSSVAYGQSTAYEDGSVNNSALVTNHVITLTNLISGTLYHYQVTSVDESGNSASSTDSTFITTGGFDPSGIVFDDFNTCSLNEQLWDFVDPLGDATQVMTGTFTQDAWLSISVPAGTSHDVWTAGNQAPRIMQPANNTDFELEVKFESGLSQQYQMQGVLIEEDSDDFLRFDFHSDGSKTKIFAAIFEPGSSEPLTPTVKYDQAITDTTGVAPLYMRVKREGHQWTQSYSYDRLSWTTSISFTHPLSVTSVGAFVGNAGSSPPAHTGYIDYFFSTALPFVSEDEDRNTLTVHVVGDGVVTVAPDQSTYSCNDPVTLTATPDPDWTFSGWSGALSGSDNPATLTMTGSKDVTATFVSESAYQIFLPLVTRSSP